MTWLWFAVRPAPPEACRATAAIWTAEEEPAGHLIAWERSTDRPNGAAKIDGKAVDPSGGPGWVSLVLPKSDETLPFDDPSVSGALRRVLRLPPAPVFSTLSGGEDRWLGALTGDTGPGVRLDDDPFAAVGPRRVPRVDAGFLGHTPALPGPVIQRYGSGHPWPGGHH